MVKIQCRDLVLHFNKKHLEDQSIPMWVVKTKGQSFYVNHIMSTVPWSTKETPGNEHTKGSIKIKNCVLTITNDNSARISALSEEDKDLLKKSEGPAARIIIDENFPKIKKYLDSNNIEYSPIKKVAGGCSTLFFVTDIMKKSDMVLLSLTFNGSYRILQPNEEYYKKYTSLIEQTDPADMTQSLFGKIKSIFTSDTDDEEEDDMVMVDINDYDTMDDDDE